jgi:hypothetical protein
VVLFLLDDALSKTCFPAPEQGLPLTFFQVSFYCPLLPGTPGKSDELAYLLIFIYDPYAVLLYLN